MRLHFLSDASPAKKADDDLLQDIGNDKQHREQDELVNNWDN
jgi:hypothetical protein